MSKTLKLLDINKFIDENKLEEITSPEIFLFNSNTFDPKGVYSEEIFGRLGSDKRMTTFAYIDLKGLYIHPEVFDILKQIVPSLQKVIYGAKRLIFDKSKGIFVEPKENSNNTGNYGPKFIYESLKSDKFNWDYYIKKNKNVVEFIKENLDLIFITKWLVIPAGIRDIQEINNKYQEQDISKEYRKLIYLIQSKQNKIDTENSLVKVLSETNEQDTILLKIQNTLIKIDRLIKDKMKSKSGLIRGFKLSKRVDHSARLVLGENKDLKGNEVEIPWFVLLKLYEPFVMHYVANDDRFSIIKDQIIKKYDKFSIDAMRDYFSYIAQYPDTVSDDVKENIIEILDIIINGKEDGVEKYLIVLRHPVESRDSILGMKPVIDKSNSYVAKLPQVLFGSLGADVDGKRYATMVCRL